MPDAAPSKRASAVSRTARRLSASAEKGRRAASAIGFRPGAGGAASAGRSAITAMQGLPTAAASWRRSRTRRVSTSRPRATTNPRPKLSERPAAKALYQFGVAGRFGTDASLTMRASVTGKVCSCAASAKRVRKLSRMLL
ncbi:hypothetical protein NBEOAGPD_3888 [Methylobacterium gregans]|uniref:Uncharacterized protein n=1 Tax=Methylobacterium gregans TaxID=374424 RepID=A0AA37HS58_9HYPH|nr:hypothetical protein NBEOAGPD_3888 [Methylobacterium gregans]